jgi:plasmid stabilization system protein ParE
LSARVRLAPQARRQIYAAAAWWDKHRAMAPTLFLDELDDAIELLRAVPLAGEVSANRRHGTLRRVLLGRSRYCLYYFVNDDESIVEVVALWHTARGVRPPV